MTVKGVINHYLHRLTNERNKFSMGLSVRLLTLCGIAAAFAIVLLKTNYVATPLLLLLLLVIAFISLLHYARKPQEKITGFIESILSGSDILSAPTIPDDRQDEVTAIFGRITATINKIKVDKQAEYELFTEVINRMPSAVLVVDDEGVIRLSNRRAKQLLQMPVLATVNQIARQNNDIAIALHGLQSGERILLKTTINELPVQLALTASEVRFTGQIRKIITLNDIQEEVAKGEVEAWQKIIRIIAHEIINSASPINILAYNMLSIISKERLTPDDRQNLSTGLEAIANRSKGMIAFVDNYRTKTAIVAPVITAVPVERIFDHITTLFKNEVKGKIDLRAEDTPPGMTVRADERLLEQVLINLVRNSIEAADKPQAAITMHATQVGGYIKITIVDNGCGISPQNRENLFTPFFTTKEKGMGIGLFVSRNMIWAMQGQLTAQSLKDKKTAFSVCLPWGAG